MDTHPVILTRRDNHDYARVLLIFLRYHFYRVPRPPKVYLVCKSRRSESPRRTKECPQF